MTEQDAPLPRRRDRPPPATDRRELVRASIEAHEHTPLVVLQPSAVAQDAKP